MTTSSLEGWKLCLLGEFRMERHGDVRLRFGATRQDELLACLALHARTPASTDEIAERVWSADEVANPRGNLRHQLHQVRQTLFRIGLPEGVIHLTRATPKFAGAIHLVPALETDVEALRHRILRLSDVDIDEMAVLVQEFKELSSGGLIPNITSEWANEARSELNALVTTAVERTERILVAHAVPVGGEGWSTGAGNDSTSFRGWNPAPAAPLDGVEFDSIHSMWRQDAEEWLVRARVAVEGLYGPDRQYWSAMIDGRRDELVRTIDWCIENDERALAHGLAGVLARYWIQNREFGTGRNLTDRAITMHWRQDYTESYGMALYAAGLLAAHEGERWAATSKLKDAARVFGHMENRLGLALCEDGFALTRYVEGEFEQARSHSVRGLKLLEETDAAPSVRMNMLLRAASIEVADENPGRAEEILMAVRDLAEEYGAVAILGAAEYQLGVAALGEQASNRAIEHLRHAITSFRSAGLLPWVSDAMRYLGLAWNQIADSGDAHGVAKARSLFRASREIAERVNNVRVVGESLRFEAGLEKDHGDLKTAQSLAERAVTVLKMTGDNTLIALAEEARDEIAALARL